MSVVGAAPALATGTASIEPAGEAEKVVAAKLEALVPWTQDKAGREFERLPRDGGCMHETLPTKGKCRPKELPQGLPNEAECEPDWLT